MPARPELLEDLNPFDLLDQESARVDHFWSSCTEAAWELPTRCSEWTVRDMLGHLAFVEDYCRAGLDGSVKALWDQARAEGATEFDDVNGWGVERRAQQTPAEVVAEWREMNAAFRRGLRARGRDGQIDTLVGMYPSWQQAFYLASEYAAHSDDMDVPVAPDESERRTAWRARFTRYALEEYDRPVTIDVVDGMNILSTPEGPVELTDAELVEAGVARLPSNHPISDAVRALLGCLA